MKRLSGQRESSWGFMISGAIRTELQLPTAGPSGTPQRLMWVVG